MEPAVGDSGELAEAYGFTDVDGSQPQVWRYIADSAAAPPTSTPTRTASHPTEGAGVKVAKYELNFDAVGGLRKTPGVHFEREHDFAGTVERVASIMSDPAFQTALDLPDLARPDVVAHEVDGTSHHLTLRYAYIGQLDPIAQKVVGGRKLTWVQDLRIDVATGVGTLGFSADGVGGRSRRSPRPSPSARPVTRRVDG